MCNSQSLRGDLTAGKGEGGEKPISGSIGAPRVAMVADRKQVYRN
jgi:hypothetical protein